jgi:hypothetical protein
MKLVLLLFTLVLIRSVESFRKTLRNVAAAVISGQIAIGKTIITHIPVSLLMSILTQWNSYYAIAM